MKKFILSTLMLLIVATCSVQADVRDIEWYDSDYTVSLPVRPGEHFVVYLDDESCEPANLENELAKYNGNLFQEPQMKEAIHQANVRTGPGMGYDIVDRYIEGDIVEMYGEFDGADVDNNWSWYLLKDGTYVCTHLFTDVISENAEPVKPNRASYSIYFFDELVQKTARQKANVRSGPGTEFPIAYSIETGNVVHAIGTVESIFSEYTWCILEDGNFVANHLLVD